MERFVQFNMHGSASLCVTLEAIPSPAKLTLVASRSPTLGIWRAEVHAN